MASPIKIDPFKLQDLILEGKKGVEIAEFFGVSAPAVTQAKRKLSVAIAKVAAEQKQRNDITRAPEEDLEIDYMLYGPPKKKPDPSSTPSNTQTANPPAIANKPFEGNIRASATRAAPLIVKNAEDAKAQLSVLITRAGEELGWISEFVPQIANEDYRAWQELSIKHMAEIRKLISAMVDVEYKLNHIDNVQKALLIMYQEIAYESRECQKRIKDRLEKASILFHLDDQQA